MQWFTNGFTESLTTWVTKQLITQLTTTMVSQDARQWWQGPHRKPSSKMLEPVDLFSINCAFCNSKSTFASLWNAQISHSLTPPFLCYKNHVWCSLPAFPYGQSLERLKMKYASMNPESWSATLFKCIQLTINTMRGGMRSCTLCSHETRGR